MLYTGGESAKKNPVILTERLNADSVQVYPHLIRRGQPMFFYRMHVSLGFDDDFGSAQNIRQHRRNAGCGGTGVSGAVPARESGRKTLDDGAQRHAGESYLG